MSRDRSRAAGSRAGTGRGVSDVLAYVVLFSIIVTGVGLVSFGALDVLVEASDREQVENGERGLVAAAATLDDIHRQSDTQRTFNLPLNGGTVLFNESAINVSSADAPRLNGTYAVNSLEYRFERRPEDVTISYEGGGVFRSPAGTERYRPAIRCAENDVVVVSVVRLDAANFRVTEGDDGTPGLNVRSLPSDAPVADVGRSLIFSAEVDDVRRNYTTFATPGTVRVNVSRTANPTQWDRYFARSDSEWTEAGDSVWECENVDAALVRVTTIRLRL